MTASVAVIWLTRPQEEMQRLKETQVHSQALYEKEIRRARKEAFKSSSAVVKLQEELKTTRNRSTLMREEVEAQKRRVQEVEKGCFAAQYQLVGVQEELEKLQQQMHAVEAERDALRTNLQEEEVARIAAEGRIPLPLPDEPDEFSSPKRNRPVEMVQPAEPEQPVRKKKKIVTKAVEEIDWEKYWQTGEFAELGVSLDPNDSEDEREFEVDNLKTQLRWQIRAREKSDKLVKHMQMECQFRTCSCRLAERSERTFVHDNSMEDGIKKHMAIADRVSKYGAAQVNLEEDKKRNNRKERESIVKKVMERQDMGEGTITQYQESQVSTKQHKTPAEPLLPLKGNETKQEEQQRGQDKNKWEKREASSSPTAQSMPNTPATEMVIDETDSDSEPLIEFSPTTGTFRTIVIPQNFLQPQVQLPRPQEQPLDDPFQSTFSLGPPPMNPIPLSNSPSLLNLEPSPPPPTSAAESPIPFSIPPDTGSHSLSQSPSPTPPPRTPHYQSSPHTKTITTTTTVPLADPETPAHHSSTPARPWTTPFKSPATMSRAEALESIQRRRELRARTIAIPLQESTPARDPGVRRAASARRVATTPAGGRGHRRDISAPATPATTGRRVVTAPAGKGVEKCN